ncbi:prepilin-type N-terminal cleavage/methylation domain-containing protein [Pseudomaricurvus sp. HS19]|nr:type IV pilin protein [Pseudomaricurvus sp. HS19]MYM64594.1 prepilin-type N-terminal cleavage/methylation domain-containing protein [Pseudomaricurvus sp. HS19]
MIKRSSGFTLIELLIVIVILGILTSVALPGYQDHVRKTRRADAQGALTGLAQAMERHFTSNVTYATGSAATVPTIFATQAPIDSPTKYYDLRVTASTATTYTLQAIPIAGTSQVEDGRLRLDNFGNRAWDRNANGAYDADELCWAEEC